MRIMVAEQYKRTGRKLKNIKCFIGDLNIDEKTRMATCYQIEEPYRDIFYPIKVQDFWIGGYGLLLKGLQSYDQKRWWYQEWWCTPVIRNEQV